MSITHRQSLSITTNGANSVQGSDTEAGSVEQAIDETFTASTTNSYLAVAFSAASLQSVILVSSQNMTVKYNGVNAVQQVSMSGPPTAGTFTLTYGGQTTAAIAYNATAAAVSTALQAISSIGSGNVECTGGPLPGSAVNVTFIGTLGLQPITTMTHTDSLTGGTASVTSTTSGVTPTLSVALQAGNPLMWGKSAGYFSNPFTTDVQALSITCTTSSRLQGKFLTA